MDKSTRDEMAAKYEGLAFKDLAKSVKALEKRYSTARAKETALKEELDFLTINVIPEKMAEEGMTSIKIDGVGRIQLSSQAWCTVPEGQRSELYKWLRQHKMSEMIGQTVNSSSLKSLMMERFKEGQKLPPEDVVNFRPYMRASVVKA